MALYDESMGNSNSLDSFYRQQSQGLIQSPSSYASPGTRYGAKLNPSSLIYMGQDRSDVKTPGPYAPGQGNLPGLYFGKAKEMSYGEARLLPAQQWDEKTMRDFINRGILYKIPGFSPDMGLPEVLDKWDDMLQISYLVSQGDKKMTPWDIMDTYGNSTGKLGTVRKGDWLYDVSTGERIKYVGPKTKTTTEKRVNLSSPEEARALTTSMLTELLGRAPTAKEMAQYKAAINDYEQKNPEMATTTQTLNDMGEVVNTSTTTSGGASQAALSTIVSDQAKQNPEYAKYQAGTTYYNALLQLLGG